MLPYSSNWSASAKTRIFRNSSLAGRYSKAIGFFPHTHLSAPEFSGSGWRFALGMKHYIGLNAIAAWFVHNKLLFILGWRCAFKLISWSRNPPFQCHMFSWGTYREDISSGVAATRVFYSYILCDTLSPTYTYSRNFQISWRRRDSFGTFWTSHSLTSMPNSISLDPGRSE